MSAAQAARVAADPAVQWVQRDRVVRVTAQTTPTGIDRANADASPSTGISADDGNGHGTHVAGTVGAIDGTAGVVGMAPGARIWPVRVLNNAGSGSWSDVICGIDYVTANADRIEVANMSLGGGGPTTANAAAPAVTPGTRRSAARRAPA